MPRIILIISFLLLSLFIGTVEAGLLSQDSKIIIKGHFTDNPKSFCRDWRITEENVKLFFTKAHQISVQKMHQEFDWLPCYASGEIIDKSVKYSWTIRLIGIGTLITPEGKIITYGCKNCDEMF